MAKAGQGQGWGAPPVPMATGGTGDEEFYSFSEGEAVSVFYRYEYDGSTDGAEAYFPVATFMAGSVKPRMGKTACWQPAKVVASFTSHEFDPHNVIGPHGTGVLVELAYPLWCNRAGHALDVSSPKNTQVRIHPRDVVRGPPPQPEVSFVVLRWGGHCRTPDYNELPGEEGGWGRMGTSISDGFIQAVFDRVYARLGHTYEVLSVYVSGSHDLQRVTATAVLPQLSGKTYAGCYFLWPIAFADQAHLTAGYVEKNSFFSVMQELECAGCETAFPHHGFLYNMLIAKDWCSYTSGNQEMKTPATTKVMRSVIERNGLAAAEQAIEALTAMSASKVPVRRGVCKLGYSWEASDVMSFDNAPDLAKKLQQLLKQNGCLADHVIVQEFIESDLEIRVFVVDGAPIHFLYTKFCTNTANGAFTAFRCVQRDEAVREWFAGDSAAMGEAEKEILRLTQRWMAWLRGVCSKPPSFLRLDYFVKRVGSGAAVHIGELTEMGASCLGWADGWTAQFDAVIHAATGLPFPPLKRIDVDGTGGDGGGAAPRGGGNGGAKGGGGDNAFNNSSYNNVARWAGAAGGGPPAPGAWPSYPPAWGGYHHHHHHHAHHHAHHHHFHPSKGQPAKQGGGGKWGK